MEELETVQRKVEIEDEVRRGIVGIEEENGTPMYAIMGRLCLCSRHLGGEGSDPAPGCAWKCAGCYNYKHDGVVRDHNGNYHGLHAAHNGNHGGGQHTHMTTGN